MRLIDADELYKRTAEWEEQAQDEVNKNKGCRTVEEWDKYKEWLIILNERSSFKYDIADAPTIEAEPVKHGVIELTYEEYGELYSYALADEQNHGEWLIDKSGSLMCSKCGTLLDEFQKPSRFCPNCGAKMDGEENG